MNTKKIHRPLHCCWFSLRSCVFRYFFVGFSCFRCFHCFFEILGRISSATLGLAGLAGLTRPEIIKNNENNEKPIQKQRNMPKRCENQQKYRGLCIVVSFHSVFAFFVFLLVFRCFRCFHCFLRFRDGSAQLAQPAQPGSPFYFRWF